jgi:hypothetical protein
MRRPPTFDDLVGTDLDPEEHARLRRVHDLLLAAGPPPEPPAGRVIPLEPRRRRVASIPIAAAVAVLVFALGVAVGSRSDARHVDFTVPMSGTSEVSGASGTLTVYDLDEAGNWPMELDVDGLPPPTDGGRYELWLTKAGEPAVLCGSFLTDPAGSAVVPLNAPYRFSDFDGWIVVEQGSSVPLMTT